MAGVIMTEIVIRDIEYGGGYRVSGTVTELGVAGHYQVRLFSRYSGQMVRETFSGADGAYLFNYIAFLANGYFVIAFDHGSNPLNAAIADFITPEPMP